METLRRELRERGDTTLLSREEQEAGRQAFLRRWDGRSDIWVFGYGSLMWNPAIHVAETQAAKVHGLHRAFCMKLVLGRATPERPGLMLALDHGGSCRGMAHRIAAEHVESETEILWMREMITGSYRPAWISLKVGGRRSCPAGLHLRDQPGAQGGMRASSSPRQLQSALRGPKGSWAPTGPISTARLNGWMRWALVTAPCTSSAHG